MNPRKIREDLGRAKASANRNELERALSLVLLALKDLGGQSSPMDLRGDFREGINSVTALASRPSSIRAARSGRFSPFSPASTSSCRRRR